MAVLPGDVPDLPQANRSWGYFFKLQASQHANWQAEWVGGEQMPVLPPSLVWLSDCKYIYTKVIMEREITLVL